MSERVELQSVEGGWKLRAGQVITATEYDATGRVVVFVDTLEGLVRQTPSDGGLDAYLDRLGNAVGARGLA